MAALDNLEWNGPAVSAKLKAAQLLGINKTMGACVTRAKSNHSWKNQSGILEGGIRIVNYAAAQGDAVRGTWGVLDVRYALIHEIGGVIKAKSAKSLVFTGDDGELVFVKSVTIPAQPYLRPAADVEYPKLAGRIRAEYEKSGG